MMKKRNPTLSTVAAILIAGATALAAAEKPPNIVLILADDQGWNGLSVEMDSDVPASKSDFYETPNLARFANEGMRFSHGYASAPVCSPTRHSIQFGMSPAKTRVTHNSSKQKQFCDPELALANLIKQADPRYATAHFGKWHVSATPTACGYDLSDGNTGNKDGNPRNQRDDPKRVYEVTERAVAFMEGRVQEAEPFFLQVSHYADHLKFAASPTMREKYMALPPGKRHSDTVFAGMNEDLDAGVGAILDAIDQLQIRDNTFVFYLADNGFDESNDRLHGIARRKAWPLSYSKGFVLEGGIRVPFIVRGPGIKAGSFSEIPVVGHDLMPTFLEIIKPDFVLPDMIEGGSMFSVLRGEGEGRIVRPSDFLIFHYPTGVWPAQTALIKGDHKIVKSWAFDRVELFDLRTDLSEQNNLSKQNPELATELHQIMMTYLESVNAILPPEQELKVDRSGKLMKKTNAATASKYKQSP